MWPTSASAPSSYSITETGDTTLSGVSGLEAKGGQWSFVRTIEVAEEAS